MDILEQAERLMDRAGGTATRRGSRVFNTAVTYINNIRGVNARSERARERAFTRQASRREYMGLSNG